MGESDDVDDVALLYVCGSEFDPGDSRGEDRLVLRVSGRYDLINRHRGNVTEWRGDVGIDGVERIDALLASSGFPEVPPHNVPAGSALRMLTSGEERAVLAFHAGGEMPGYKELFATLDGIVFDARRGAPHSSD